MEDPVVTAAQIAFSARIKDSSDVSENTKNAQAITKAWRGAVHTLDPDRFQIEALVAGRRHFVLKKREKIHEPHAQVSICNHGNLTASREDSVRSRLHWVGYQYE